MKLFNLLTNATSTGAGTVANAANQPFPAQSRTIQVSGKTTAGAGAAAVDIEVSNNGRVWLTLAT